MENKRSAERVRKTVKAEVRTSEGMTFSSSVDISEGGVFISTPEPLNQGDEVDLSIPMSSDDTIDVKGIIRWNRDELDDQKAGMGIEFVGMTGEDKEKLNSVLHS